MSSSVLDRSSWVVLRQLPSLEKNFFPPSPPKKKGGACWNSFFWKESLRFCGWVFPCSFFFFLNLPLNTWLTEVRQTLYAFRTSSVTCSLFPDDSHSGQMKKAASDGQQQMPWLGCKNSMAREQITRAIFQPPVTCCSKVSWERDHIFMFKSMLYIIQTAFCPSYPSFYLCHGIAVIVPDSRFYSRLFIPTWVL